MPVADWFEGWAVRLTARLPREDWPYAAEEEGALFWADLRAMLARHGVTEAVADAAAARLVEDPPRFVADLGPKLLAAVRDVWDEQPADRGGPPDSREAAEAASRECRWCSGTGLARVARRDGLPFRARTAGGLAIECLDVVMACACPMGRWILARNTKPPHWIDLARCEAKVLPASDAKLRRRATAAATEPEPATESAS